MLQRLGWEYSVWMFAKIGEINMTDGWLLDSDLGEALHENEIEIAQQIAVP
jgi:hypothetical protein